MTVTSTSPEGTVSPAGTPPPAGSTAPAGETAQVHAARPHRPASAPAAAPIAILLGLVLLAAGAVLIRDALVGWNILTGGLWTTSVLSGIDGFRAQTWVLPAGAGVALIGLWFLVSSVRPRRRRELSLGTPGAAWLRQRDVASIARAAAGDVSGVTGVKVSGSRTAVRLQITTTAALTGPIQTAVTDAVTSALSPLTPSPSVRVRARTLGASS